MFSLQFKHNEARLVCVCATSKVPLRYSLFCGLQRTHPKVGVFRMSSLQHTRVFGFFVHFTTINQHHLRHGSTDLYYVTTLYQKVIQNSFWVDHVQFSKKPSQMYNCVRTTIIRLKIDTTTLCNSCFVMVSCRKPLVWSDGHPSFARRSTLQNTRISCFVTV